MTSRCLLSDQVFDLDGNAVENAKVYFFLESTAVTHTEPTAPTGTAITGNFYAARSGGSPLANPVLTDENGYFEVWLQTSQRLDVVISDNNGTATIGGTTTPVTPFDQEIRPADVQVAPADAGGGTIRLVPGNYDYFIAWDGTNATAYLGSDGSTAFGPTANFATVWNQVVAVLKARTIPGGRMQYGVVDNLNSAIPYTATLNTCDGLQIVGPGFSKRTTLDSTSDYGPGCLVATATFTTSTDIPSTDGNVGLDVWSRGAQTNCTAAWAANVVTITKTGIGNTSTNPEAIAVDDKIQTQGFSIGGASGYNTVEKSTGSAATGDGQCVTVTAVTNNTIAYAQTSDPGGAGTGGIVFPEGHRASMKITGMSMYGGTSGVVATNAIWKGKGLGQLSIIRDNMFQGGSYNVAQGGTRGESTSNFDMVINGNTFSYVDTSATENALYAQYVGDCWSIQGNNMAVAQGNAYAFVVQAADGGLVRIGPNNHVGGGTATKPRVLWTAGQNGYIEGLYLDNVKDTVNGGVLIQPNGLASVNNINIINNNFHLTATTPLVTLDRNGQTAGSNINISGNATNQTPTCVVSFVSWTSTKLVNIVNNHVAGGNPVVPLTLTPPTGQEGEWAHNTIIGNNAVGGGMQEEFGTATISSGAVISSTISHHLWGAPTRILVTPRTQLIDNAGLGVAFWVSAITATTFKINLSAIVKDAAAGSNIATTYDWHAYIRS